MGSDSWCELVQWPIVLGEEEGSAILVPLLQKFLLPAIVPTTPLANVKSALTSLSQITWLQNNLKYSVQSRKLSHKYVATGCSVQKVLVKILPTTSESEGWKRPNSALDWIPEAGLRGGLGGKEAMEVVEGEGGWGGGGEGEGGGGKRRTLQWCYLQDWMLAYELARKSQNMWFVW